MKKILVIDDDAKIVDYLTTLFEDNGYVTVSAGDVSEALEIAQKEMPDLITLDMEMPGEWGPRFYRKMSRDKNIKNIPIIVISGMSGTEYAVSKAIATIKKPFDRDELLKIVNEALK